MERVAANQRHQLSGRDPGSAAGRRGPVGSFPEFGRREHGCPDHGRHAHAGSRGGDAQHRHAPAGRCVGWIARGLQPQCAPASRRPFAPAG